MGLSAVQETDAILSFLGFLLVLLVLTLAAVIRLPPAGSVPADERSVPGEGPEDASGQRHFRQPQGVSSLPQRVPGQSGRVAHQADDPGEVSGAIRRLRVSGQPPWGPAPRPPGVP